MREPTQQHRTAFAGPAGLSSLGANAMGRSWTATAGTVSLSVALTVASSWALLAGAGLLSGCETQPLYVTCQLDEDVTKKGLCNGSTSADRDTSSCVVKSHPQCDRSVCLSYYGTQAICTMTCTSEDNDAECGNDAECWKYADADPETGAKAQHYCVPKATMTAALK